MTLSNRLIYTTVHYITKAAYLEPIFNLSGFFVRFLESVAQHFKTVCNDSTRASSLRICL